MTAKQNQNGKWSVEVARKGIPRIRCRCFKSQEDAEQFEREYLAKHSDAALKKRGKSAIGGNHCCIYVINVHLPHRQDCRG